MPTLPSIIRGASAKPVASTALINTLESIGTFEGELFVGYPIVGGPDGRFTIDAVWVSEMAGLVIFDLVEGNSLTDYQDRQDNAANKLEARLKVHRELVHRRKLAIPVHTITFAPAINLPVENADDYLVANCDTLADALHTLLWDDSTNEVFRATLSALQNISTIRKTRGRRNIKREDSRGAKLKRLEDSIATLDNLQGKAVIETVHGVQRIRGLAGSGKTIVLALKAAYLHAQHPEWRIAVTFNTRSLKGQIRRLINTFCIEQTGGEPDWDQLRVIHAWGAPGGGERDGLYHEFCSSSDSPYFDFRSAKSQFGSSDAFGRACGQALSKAKAVRPLYDAILVDEAQDFPVEFMRLCYAALNDDKRLVYAYDELQNLSGKSLPSPEELFGKNEDGTPLVSFPEPKPNEPRRDIILETCYRNSRPVLVTAHALGFGIYRSVPPKRDTGLVQMFDDAELWRDIGYEVKNGPLREDRDVRLARTSETSPPFLENHSTIDDLIQFRKFASKNEQTMWVVKAIEKNLKEDELRFDDIVVINPDPVTTRKEVGAIRAELLKKGINSHLAGVDTVPDIFFQPDVSSVTFTGIYRAKGNEAGMVYIINADDCATSLWNLATLRNRLFTAITRSKAWVRVLGVGEGMATLIQEFDKLKRLDFELQFHYPTAEQREQLSIVHRDMTVTERKKLESRQKDIESLISDLEAGNVQPEDLDPALLEKLEKLLRKQR